MICKRCGTENPKHKNVCLKCGAFLYDTTTRRRVPLSAEERVKRRKLYAKGTIKGCAFIFLLMIGLFIVVVIFSFLFAKLITPPA